MPAPLIIRIIGDATAYMKAAEQTIAMNMKLAGSTTSTNTVIGATTARSAQAEVAATAKAIRAEEAHLASLKALQAQGVETYTLIAASQAKLNRLTGASATPSLFGRAKGFAGIAGVGFLSAVAAGEITRHIISSAEDLEAAQRSLDQAIENTGGNVAILGAQYDETAKAASQFGVSQVTATQELARATSLTGDAASAQRAYTEALVVSKALGKDFNAVLIATSKAQGGMTTALRRLGVLVDANATGQEQYNAIMKRYKGQAEANTTATEKFGASISNLGTAIGSGLLPVITPAIEGLTKLLNVLNQLNEPTENESRIQQIARQIARQQGAFGPVGPRGPAGGGPFSFASFTNIAAAVAAEAKSLRDIWGKEERVAIARAQAAEKARALAAQQLQDSIDPLRLEVALSRAQALGKPLTKILKELRQAAYKALRSGKLSLEQQKEAWDQIASLNEQLTNQASTQAKGIRAANTRILTADLGLTKAQEAELRARLASLDARGRSLHHAGVGAFGYEIGRDDRPIQINLDGRKIAENTTNHQHRRRRRNSSQRRGPNAGD